MTSAPDITATVIFHREGAFALPALASLRDLVDRVRFAGLTIEARAVLDRADDLTRHLIAARGNWLSGVEEVSVGDPGLARNAGTASARGNFLAFLDGDDLWGADWLCLAHKAATAPGVSTAAVWHPECVYYFYESDFDRCSPGKVPNSGVKSFFMMHGSNDVPDFDRDILLLDNVWTANAFAPRELHLRYPYPATCKEHGVGFEDWMWNIATLWAGIPHRVVPDTVHLIRVKESDSLGLRNATEGRLPDLPDSVRLTPRGRGRK